MKNIRLYLILALFVLGVILSRHYSHNINEEYNPTVVYDISDDSLLTLVEYRTFQYFWDGAEPVSGMAKEKIYFDGDYPEDNSIVTTGGTGFGVMGILVGIERGFITRNEGFERIRRIVSFLDSTDRFHGAWPHLLNGETGKVRSDGINNGADIVQTAFLIQGLLTVRQYFINGSPEEKDLSADINRLWREVDWGWFTRGGQNVMYWDWSPDSGWKANHQVKGYNEGLILYVLAASSPTHPVHTRAYHEGWAGMGRINGVSGKYGYVLTLKHNGASEYGGPLSWSHYSFLGLDPRNLKDRYADYWDHNLNHTLLNWQWCALNPKNYKGYSDVSWGLTGSNSLEVYSVHAPGEHDLGVISPTAAVSSMPYTPQRSMDAMKHFYFNLGDKIWGEYGFYDAFSEQYDWYPQRYLASNQGPQIIMIENYRTGFLWNLFMSSPEIQNGLKRLGFTW